MFFSIMAWAQNPTFVNQVAQIDKANTAASWKNLATQFEKTAKAEPSNWYAQYYTALSYIEWANASAKNIDALCDKAEIYLNRATVLEKNNPENYILKAYLLSAKIQENPMLRGMKYGKESKRQLDIAFQLDRRNPRYFYIRGRGIYHTPSLFGGGSKKAKSYLEKAMEFFKTEKSASALAPSWGKKQTQQLLSSY